MPYQMDEQSRNISPLKLYDYFATGKPIVSTYFPEVAKFDNVVRIAKDKNEFNSEIKNALSDNDRDLWNKRKIIAQKNTWDTRVKQISEVLNLFLN
jgi:hypothetical protein